MASEHEMKFNIALARLLRQKGLDARSEVKQAGGRMLDVLVQVDGSRVVLEGEIGNRKGALKDARARLEQGLADVAIAVSYPEIPDPERDLREVEAAPVDGEWRWTDMAELASLVRATAKEVGNIDRTARKFRDALENAADRLTDKMTEDAVRVSNIPVRRKDYSDAQKQKRRRLRVALLVASAALFHANLDGSKIRPPKIDARRGGQYQGEWPPIRLKECVATDNCLDQLVGAWETILALDYKPVFESAVNVLNALPPGPEANGFARACAKAGLEAAGSLAGRRHDLLGRVFHWILDTAANTGAYYTSDSAATLLAGLAIRETDADRLDDFTVVDPACGTGTLLMATAQRLGQLTSQAQGEVGGKHLIEKVLKGYDIEAAAIQMAAVALGLLNPSVSFERMGIHQPDYGIDRLGTGKAGSLELYGERAAVSLYTPVSKQVDTGQEEVLKAVRHDLVIMNPPYARDQLRHGHLTSAQQTAVKERETELFKGIPAAREGGSGMFLLLADRLCDEENGTLAAVLPTACFHSGKTVERVWSQLLNGFHLETVVTSHDPQRIYFSENTDINESLVVLRRLNDDNSNLDTRFINLPHNPNMASDALAVAKSIRSDDEKGFLWPRERIEAGDWMPVKFLTPYLIETATKWFADGKLQLLPLGKLAQVGPAGRRTQDAYTLGDLTEADEHGRWGLWFNNQEGSTRNGAPPKQTLRARPDCSLLRKADKIDLADRYWSQRGRLLLPAPFRISTVRTFATRTDEKVLGARWVLVRSKDSRTEPEMWEKAMCIYLNSTIGILAQICVSKPKLLARPEMPLDNMRRIPVPQFDDRQVSALADHYNRVADRPLLRLRDQEDDLVRASLDETVCLAMDWDQEEVRKVRFALATEPSVTGQPAQK